MFSEYASKFLTKPRTAPLFQGSTGSLDSDTEAFLGWVDNSVSSEEDSPPDEIAIERPLGAQSGTGVAGPSGLLGGAQSILTGARAIAPQPDAHPSSTINPLSDSIPSLPPTAPSFSYLESVVGAAYITITAMTLAIAALVSFSTLPTNIGVYPVFGKSSWTLIFIGVLSIAAAWGWLWAMRSNPKGMVQLNTFAVPFICICTATYGFFGSFHSANGHSLIHTAMRLGSSIPLLAAIGWVYVLRRDKNNVGRASEMIALALEVLNGSPLLLTIGCICGLAATIFTYLWILFVSRAFLEGSLSILFALLFSFVYFWTWALLVNLQRCVIALLTHSWVEQRHSQDSWALIIEIAHRFGGCALSALLLVSARAPAFILGRRLGRMAQVGLMALSPASIVAIVDPLTLTVAVTQRSSLAAAAHVVLSPAFSAADRRTYWLAKMFLGATKITFSLVVAFIAWVHADRIDTTAAVYSYLIAIAAFTIGWTIFGTADNTLGMVLDGLLVNNVLYPKRRELRVFEHAE